MTKREFDNLKENDLVILNGMCRINAGIKCRVTNVIHDEDTYYCRIWVEPVDDTIKLSILGGCIDDWNEISYKAANIVKES